MKEPKYLIKPDEHCWVICKRTIAGEKAKKPGKVTYSPFKYPANLKQACELLLELAAREQLAQDEFPDANAILRALAGAQEVVLAAIPKEVK